MVKQQAAACLALARCARDHDHRRLLGECGRDRVHHVERAGAVGDRGDAEAAMRARSGVSGEADGRLVAERVQRQPAGFLDLGEQREREVAGDAEYLVCAVCGERGEQRLGDVHAHARVGRQRGVRGRAAPARAASRCSRRCASETNSSRSGSIALRAESMPTMRPPSTTGRWRKPFSCMISSA